MRKESDTSRFTQQLYAREEFVKKQLSIVDRELSHRADGGLKITRRGQRHYYSLQRFNSVTKKYECTYINKKNMGIARKIATHDYYSNIRRVLLKEIKLLKELISNEFEKTIDNCYFELCDGRREIVSPLAGTAQSRIDSWMNEVYEPNTSYPETLTHRTERGEMVRSKSEELIANYLYSQREYLDYKYERPMEVKVNGKKETIYPDFTIINLRTGETFILEHVSRLDIPSYHDKFVWKHRAFIENGFIQNGMVFYSFESEKYPFSLKHVKKLVQEVFLK